MKLKYEEPKFVVGLVKFSILTSETYDDFIGDEVVF